MSVQHCELLSLKQSVSRATSPHVEKSVQQFWKWWFWIAEIVFAIQYVPERADSACHPSRGVDRSTPERKAPWIRSLRDIISIFIMKFHIQNIFIEIAKILSRCIDEGGVHNQWPTAHNKKEETISSQHNKFVIMETQHLDHENKFAMRMARDYTNIRAKRLILVGGC